MGESGANIRVIINGALGRMGREIASGLSKEPGISVIGGIDPVASPDEMLPLANGSKIHVGTDMSATLAATPVDVVVDFTIAEAAFLAARTTLARGVNIVIGTTGLSGAQLAEIERVCRENGVGAVVASNFALGAVLLMQMARLASRYFDYAEIIELHHEKKVDAPSGTALATATAMYESRGKPFLYSRVEKETLNGTRGGEVSGVAIHSVRLPGMLAHQEVVFGGAGQTLTLRHDTLNRECYLPGVALAVREVSRRKGLTVGLDNLLGFDKL